ncbi:MAG: M67 family metallopeptidase [Cytophagales bacterium]|nr:M67 family metallopeptidase [Armatimonadota bacterium]
MPQTITLPEAARAVIVAHGEAGFPDEVCGFLVGAATGDQKTVTEAWAIENAWEQAGDALAGAAADTFLGEAKGRRFFIPPGELQKADQRARAMRQDILGFYHTHPDHPARPSAHDLAMAQGTFPGYSYIILQVQDGSAAEMTSWVLRDDYSEFDEERITPSPMP